MFTVTSSKLGYMTLCVYLSVSEHLRYCLSTHFVKFKVRKQIIGIVSGGKVWVFQSWLSIFKAVEMSVSWCYAVCCRTWPNVIGFFLFAG
jgi:hypothetical protein